MKDIKDKFIGFLLEKNSYETFLKKRYLYRRIRHKPNNKINEAYIVNPKWGKKCKKFYVLRMPPPLMGPLAIARILLLIYPWLERNGYIPLVECCYLVDYNEQEHPRINFWEKLFIQDYNIEKLLENKEQIIFEGLNEYKKDKMVSDFLEVMNGKGEEFQYKYLGGETGREYYRKWGEISEKCLKLTPQITQIEDSLGYLFGNEGETIAVIFRAGFTKAYYDKTSKEDREALSYHPKVPSVGRTLELLDDYLRTKKYKYIFLCCEDQEIIEKFKVKYEEKLVTIERRQYMNSYPPCTSMDPDEIKEVFNEKVLLSQYIPYVQEVYVASKCKYLFGCVCSGTLMALVWNSGFYKDVFILPDENPNSEY